MSCTRHGQWAETSITGGFTSQPELATEVWTWRSLVTFYTVFVIELASPVAGQIAALQRRIPDDRSCGRSCGVSRPADHPVGFACLICDRDAKWSAAVRARLEDAGLRVIQTPYRERRCKRLCRTVRPLDQKKEMSESPNFRSASVIIGGLSPSLSPIIIASGITKVWTTN